MRRDGNPEKIIRQIEEFIIRKMYHHRKKGVVIGLSGGADSTLVAVIAKRAFDRARAEGGERFGILGLCMPSKTNKNEDLVDGMAIASRLEIPCRVIDIGPIVTAYLENIKTYVYDFDQGNMMSRIRANLLHTHAATKGYSVIGTGNRDEDFGIGYYTLFGDGAVHFSPIGDLPKRMVQKLLTYLGFSDAALREPTAGLEEGQTDFKDLGYSYEFVEACMRAKEGEKRGVAPVEMDKSTKIVMERIFLEDHHRYKRLFGEVKFERLSDAYLDFARRHQNAKLKAQLVSPEVCMIDWEDVQ